MAALILPYVYPSTVLYLPSVAIATSNTIAILLHVSVHSGVYYVTIYSPVVLFFNTPNQYAFVGGVG